MDLFFLRVPFTLCPPLYALCSFSIRHAVAFEDEGSMAMVHELNGRIALLEGDLATAAEALNKSMGMNSSSSGCGWQRPLIPC